jgi:hypothetical protein
VTLAGIQQAQAGVYKVIYTNASGCQSSIQTFTLNVTTEPVTGLQDEGARGFQMYPNPTASTIIIPNASKLRRVSVRDVHGQLITSVHPGGDNTTVHLGDLPAGIYLIELVDHRNTTTIRKVVKK